MLETILNSVLFSTIALTLIHFLWQGAAVAVVLKTALIITPKQYSRLRYSFASVAMLAHLLFPIITFFLLYQPDYLSINTQANIEASPLLGLSLLAEESSLNEGFLNMLPYLTIVWLSAVFCLACKFVFQMVSVNQIPKKNTQAPCEELNKRFLELVKTLNIKKSPRLIVSLSIDVPMAIGWIKPVVLLPASMVTGLTPTQLDMLLLHELAHIRRHDYLVNLIQSVVELCLFFHPAVYWVSKQMRVEREFCSDDIAVQHCGDAFAYAHTLTDTASLCNKHRHAIPTMAMAASGGDLKERVLRLVNHHSCTSTYDKSKWLASVVIIFSFLLLTSKELAQLNYLDISQYPQASSGFETGQRFERMKQAKPLAPFVETSIQQEQKADSNIQQSSIAQALINSSNTAPADNKDNTIIQEVESTLEKLESPAKVINEKPKQSQTHITKSSVQQAITQTSVDTPSLPQNQKTLTALPQSEQSKKAVLPAKKLATKTPVLNDIKTASPIPAVKQQENTVTKTASEKALNKEMSLPKVESVPELTVAAIKKPIKQVSNPYQAKVAELTQPIKHQDAISKFEQNNLKIINKPAAIKPLIAEPVAKPKDTFNSAKILTDAQPKYPSWAQRKKVELDLLVNFTIGVDGLVKDIQIEKKGKSGYFKTSILKAMSKWRFQPALKNGVAVESAMSKIFSFNLAKY